MRALATIVASVVVLSVASSPPLVAGDRIPSAAKTTKASSPGKETMKIRISINGRVATATLDNTPTARDFAALLPLSVTLSDYASTEKVSDLPRKLTQQGAPPGYEPKTGDITLYAPWGNLAIFYRDFKYSTGLIRLGAIDTGLEALNQSGSLPATIEMIQP
ncbi:cyclophilin-like fold protein [Bosea sp. CRIB-10]|uniref:cyclophilin-like fold protein n=1 Tax=Bosea sp. CRIB-10 TaxID=378404 RepID=UPI001FCD58C8|nr:cyclophilin-like fold protein [Bosea sp. CRIB-10]